MSVRKLQELSRGGSTGSAPSDRDINAHAQRIMGGGGGGGGVARSFMEAYSRDVDVAHSNTDPNSSASPRRAALAPPAPKPGETTGQQILALLLRVQEELREEREERAAREEQLLGAIQQLQEKFVAAGIRTVTEAVAHPHGDFDNIDEVLRKPPVIDPRGNALAPIPTDVDGLD